jgi:membrane protein YqaA with SNARE-associated domain
MAAKRPSRSLLFLTVLAAPAALAFETVLRKLLFPPEFEEVRSLLEPLLTPVGWAIAVVAAIASLVGLRVQRAMAQKRIAKLRDREDADARYREVFGVFLLTTAVPQIPAILSTFTFMFGATLWPVLASVAVSSVGVVAQAFRIPVLADELR